MFYSMLNIIDIFFTICCSSLDHHANVPIELKNPKKTQLGSNPNLYTKWHTPKSHRMTGRHSNGTRTECATL